jgi:uncharacterized protein (TIGR02466 family)
VSSIHRLQAAARLLERRAYAEARAECEHVIGAEPTNADAWNLLGLIEHHAGDARAALAALERAVAANPGYANAWQNLAGIRAVLGDHRGAIAAEQRLLELGPNSAPDDWYNLGVRAFRQGLAHLAAECFERCLARAPTHREALNNLAVAYDAARRFHEARDAAMRLLALAPQTPGSLHTFAAIYARATDPAELQRGLAAAEALLAEHPDHAGAHDSAAIILGKLGRPDDAIAHARRAYALSPGSPEFAFGLSRLLDERGLLDEADAVLQEARTRAPEHVGLARQHGTVMLRRGDPGGAGIALGQALALAPDDQSALAQRVLALSLGGDQRAALALLGFERFFRRAPFEVPEPFKYIGLFNRQLAEDIRGHSRLRFEPVGLAAKGGYLTEDLMADQTPAIVGFERSLRRAIDAYIASLGPPDPSHPFLRAIPKRYRLNLWATRVSAQGVIDTHIHEESWLSGAYYVELPQALVGDEAGSESDAGCIEFNRPHRSLPEPPEDWIAVIRPEPGLLLLFPSYYYHRTLPFEGAGERISISFDLAPAHD